jgi:hypothetical protein
MGGRGQRVVAFKKCCERVSHLAKVLADPCTTCPPGGCSGCSEYLCRLTRLCFLTGDSVTKALFFCSPGGGISGESAGKPGSVPWGSIAVLWDARRRAPRCRTPRIAARGAARAGFRRRLLPYLACCSRRGLRLPFAPLASCRRRGAASYRIHFRHLCRRACARLGGVLFCLPLSVGFRPSRAITWRRALASAQDFSSTRPAGAAIALADSRRSHLR